MYNSYASSYVEVLEIIKHIPDNEYKKIPKEKIKFYEQNKDKDYHFIYDTRNFNQLSRKTKAILVNLYKDYIASEEEKKEVDEILKLNSKKLELEKEKKYNPNTIFDNSNNFNMTNTKQKKNENEIVCIQNKKSIFNKIIQKIKKFYWPNKKE